MTKETQKYVISGNYCTWVWSCNESSTCSFWQEPDGVAVPSQFPESGSLLAVVHIKLLYSTVLVSYIMETSPWSQLALSLDKYCRIRLFIKALGLQLPLFEFCNISVKDTQLSMEYFWNRQGHMRILSYYCSAPSSLPAHCCSATDYITMHQQIHELAAIFSVSYIPLK